MKILLTFFVLLFSSSVVAGDDLTGKKLLCPSTLSEVDEYEISSLWVFNSNNQLTKYLSSLLSEDVTEHPYYKYETDVKFIKIWHIDSDTVFVKINRTTLKMYSNNEVYQKNCILDEHIETEDSIKMMLNIREERIKKIKSQNKI